jgi:multicomponent Na+:H+ antiporter subunit F
MALIDGVLVLLGLAMLAAIARLALGPTNGDRVLAVEFGFVLSVAALALLAVRNDSPALFDLVLVMTLVGFLTTMALAHLMERRP